jgi:hypothetical protein
MPKEESTPADLGSVTPPVRTRSRKSSVTATGEAANMTVTDGRRKRPGPGSDTSPGSDGLATRPADLLHVELWYDILRPVLADLFATTTLREADDEPARAGRVQVAHGGFA